MKQVARIPQMPSVPRVPLDYRVIATGSSGNAVRIGAVLVDCGIPYAKLKPYLGGVRVLLLTHIHGDHIKPATLKKIRSLHPRIEVCAPYSVVEKFGMDMVDKIINAGFEFVTKSGLKITPFEGVHDVQVYGYTWKVNGNQVLYCTDTSTMALAPTDLKIDYCFLEANYDETILNEIIKQGGTGIKKKYGYDVREGCYRHLSVQMCKGYFYTHRRSGDSKLIELHMSSRFR